MKLARRVVLLSLMIFVVIAPSYAMGQFFFQPQYQVGEAAPDFTLKTASGKTLNMTKFRGGKNAIIFFWATWCPHCRTQLHELNKTNKDLEAKGIRLILVDVGEDAKTVQGYLAKNKFGFEVFLDEESSLAEPYGLIGVPTFYFLDSKGVIKSVEHSLPANVDEIL